MGRLLQINQRFKVEVMIETFPSIPDNMKAQYHPNNPAEKASFFRHWAERELTTKVSKASTYRSARTG